MRHASLVLLVLALAVHPLAAQETALDSLLRTPVSSVAKYEQTVTQAAASVTIITGEDIRRYGYRTLDEMLRRVPGYYTTYDRNYAYVGVRGFGRPGDYNNRVLVLIDGHTTNEGVFGSASVGTDLPLDPDLIDRVEVVHGPGSALYGSGAMLTSINIITLSGRALHGARATVGGGSFGSRQASLLAGAEIARGVEVSGDAQWIDVDGQDLYYPEFNTPSTNGGVAHQLDWDRSRSAHAALKAGQFEMTAFTTTRSKGIPTASFGTNFNDPAAQTRDSRTILDAHYAWTGSATRFDLRGYYTNYSYAGTYPYSPVYHDMALDDALGTEARLRWDIGSRNRLLVGAEFVRHVRVDYSAWGPDTVYFDRKAPFAVMSLYAQDELQLFAGLTVLAGLRSDMQDGFSATASPRVALLYHPAPRTTVKLLYGEAFRAPSMYELNFESSTFKRNSALESEQISTYEAVLEQRIAPTLFATVSLHRFSMHDLIDTRVDPVDSLLYFANVTRASSQGATAALTARFRSGIGAYLSYGHERSNDGTGAVLTNSPTDVAQAGISAPVSAHALISGETRFESGRKTLTGGSTTDHVLADAHLILSLGSLTEPSTGLLRRTELSVSVRNVFGTRYSTPGFFEHTQQTILQDGRTVSVRVSVRL